MSRFRHLVRLFKGKLMASLVAYVDESGTHDSTGIHHGADVAGVFGYIATPPQWEEFVTAWLGILHSFNVRVFHASEFADRKNGPKNPSWPYLNWNDEKREDFIRQLIEIARDGTFFAVGGVVDVRAYDRLVPDALKDSGGHPYHFCFQAFIDQLAFILVNQIDPPFEEGDKIDFFFDQQNEMVDRANWKFSLIKELRDPRAHLGALSFVDKQEYIPIQAADLLAYVMRQSVSRKLRGDTFIKPGGWEDQLIARKNVAIGAFDEGNLTLMLKDMGAI